MLSSGFSPSNLPMSESTRVDSLKATLHGLGVQLLAISSQGPLEFRRGPEVIGLDPGRRTSK